MTVVGNDWDGLLAEEWQKPYYQKLRSFLKKEYESETIYPPAADIYNALKLTPYEKVKVVILGQDPYHEPGQAQGLSFSVPHEVQAPPSLINIMKELYDDLGIRYTGGALEKAFPGYARISEADAGRKVYADIGETSGTGTVRSSGTDVGRKAYADAEIAVAGTESGMNAETAAASAADMQIGITDDGAATVEETQNSREPAQYIPNIEGMLVPWAREGVLLLNTVMTVRAHRAGSHKNCGWEQFTDKVIELLASREKPLVFVLWGANAGAKTDLILRVQEESAVSRGADADTMKRGVDAGTMRTGADANAMKRAGDAAVMTSGGTGTMTGSRRHLIIRAPHPSPLSAYRGFFGGRYFSRCNYFLQDNGIEPVDWRL